ncbi:TMEM165/GDT1 family protein [Nocardioides sp. CER19]|uniref:TMEM165/GDT1 family protein n=1 Tax=Nocardioides sp. CER19 TaxID=3038538 RepID=UPI00244B2123|nr:TMEM165/GDT1 family protein [Nocardioides sp. CER19]MDH2414584.1 TMEM165/GDT1 family protein [Nocardioides sp. CER19]
MIELGVIAVTFALIFVGELPDKSAIAALVLGTRFPWRWAFTGIAAAFLAHVVIAVAAGSLLTLLPHRAVEGVVAVLFVIGAVLIWREGLEDEEEMEAEEEAEIPELPDTAGFWKIASLGFGVIFVAEWGDLTQILTANLAAKYHDPLSVGIGATLGLWAVGLLAILGGRSLIRVLPMRWITRVAAAVMVVLSVYSLLNAVGVIGG